MLSHGSFDPTSRNSGRARLPVDTRVGAWRRMSTGTITRTPRGAPTASNAASLDTSAGCSPRRVRRSHAYSKLLIVGGANGGGDVNASLGRRPETPTVFHRLWSV